ncbi:MAG: CBS domain-containing protein [Nitrospira sp.]|nr:CBS domain-containing protein [Nitrospira sp.]
MAANHRDTVVAHMMKPGVVQIPGDVSVTEAASLMERERMPCLLVKDTESSYGLMTPRDIVRKVVAQGLEPDAIAVRTIMTQPVQFIEYDRLVDEASTLMMSSGSPILIVTKENLPVGVLTVRDLILSPQRGAVQIPAVIQVLEGSDPPREYQAVIVQLSHVGALVQSLLSLLPDTPVLLSFSLPNFVTPLTIRGTVVAQPVRIGDAGDTVRPPQSTTEIQFSDLAPSDQSTIKAWMLQNATNSRDVP